VLEVGVIDQFR